MWKKCFETSSELAICETSSELADKCHKTVRDKTFTVLISSSLFSKQSKPRKMDLIRERKREREKTEIGRFCLKYLCQIFNARLLAYNLFGYKGLICTLYIYKGPSLVYLAPWSMGKEQNLYMVHSYIEYLRNFGFWHGSLYIRAYA